MKRVIYFLVFILLLTGNAAGVSEGLQPLEEYLSDQKFILEVQGQEADSAIYTIWEAHVFNGNTSQTVQELYYFYQEYVEALIEDGKTEQVRLAVEHLLAMIEERLYAKSICELTLEESTMVISLSEWYVDLLGLTDQADDLLIAALHRAADYIMTYEKEASPDTDPQYEFNCESNEQIWVLTRFAALAYSGDTEQADALAEAYLQRIEASGDEVSLLIAEALFMPMRKLLSGKPQEAAAAQVNFLELLEVLSGKPDEDYLDYLYSNDLNSVNAFGMRGIVSISDCEAYAESLPKKFSFRVTEVLDEGLSKITVGDLLVSINSVKLYSPRQAWLLRTRGTAEEIVVSSNGQMITITRDQGDGKWGILWEAVLKDAS